MHGNASSEHEAPGSGPGSMPPDLSTCTATSRERSPAVLAFSVRDWG